MTRINLVAPSRLVRQHLVAEYRELPRVFALVRAAQARGVVAGCHSRPSAYTLGKGHCMFFFDRLGFLSDRYAALVDEMTMRDYMVGHPVLPHWTQTLNKCWFGGYKPTPEALALNVGRINERLIQMGLTGSQIML